MSSEQGRTAPGASLDRAGQQALLKDLQKQVTALVADLRERAELAESKGPLEAEYDRAVRAERVGVAYEMWREDRLVQIAAAWVLACVFVRFCEDNGLVSEARISGPGERLAEAQDHHDTYFREHPERNDRDWLRKAFEDLARAHPTAGGLFDPRYNPLYEVTPSYEAASRLLAFWRERGPDGEIRYDFTDPELNTRFLGDLYQDLSEHARKTFALLQTPVFVEEFILDLTLEPAVEEFGLDPVWTHQPEKWTGEVDADGQARGLRCIDPACGSGHFLLGLFRRLLDKWVALEPGTDRWLLIRRALESVHGADKNPFAASIARFRLLVEALKAGGVRDLRAAPDMPIRVAVGDSLLHGRSREQRQETFDGIGGGEVFTYRTEDVKEYVDEVDLLGFNSYHVVVANPPYITVKDQQENQNYRDAYWTCSGKYALSVPFAQRIFDLAMRAKGSEQNGGFTGQITANSFMKREFGKVLIEKFLHGGAPFKDRVLKVTRTFEGIDLTHVIDTSGAHIPGHGTPTVILAGRNQIARQVRPIRAVLGVRGESEVPEDGKPGPVWRSITELVGKPGEDSEWVSVEDVERARFARHPWSLSGGGAADTFEVIENSADSRLGQHTYRLGVFGVMGADEAMMAQQRVFVANLIPAAQVRRVVAGDELRDWETREGIHAFFPYSAEHDLLPDKQLRRALQWMWQTRTDLGNRATFSKKTYFSEGRPWYEWHQLPKDKRSHRWSITYAFVATHNHFVLDRGGKVFKQSAPVIKLREGDGEERHLGLLGVLNSSVACFWLKQVSQGKGGSGLGRGVQDEAWEERYEFTGTKLEEFPLVEILPLAVAVEMDSLARDLAAHDPSVIAENEIPSRAALDEASDAQKRIRSRMILLQEELDWTVYGAYGLLTPDEVARTTLPGDPAELSTSDAPPLELGQRAFEIVLKRKVDRGEVETTWFERHGSTETAVAEIPADWPESYRKVVQARIDIIESNKDIRLIERPEYKRRWSMEPWKKREAAALRTWLLDAAERRELWFEERGDYVAPRPLTVFQLADALRNDEDVQAVATLYATDHLDDRNASLATVLAAVIEHEHVPYLAALRYKDSGLRKRALWEQVWEKQRKEDRTGERLDIKVPPKYAGADFLKHSYWSNRGKLDVPKERFISYPGASPDADPSLLLGWAGWNHRDQAEALVNLINDRRSVNGWENEDPRFVPLLAGLQEVLPWVKQWYDEDDEEWGGNPAEEFQTVLNRARAERSLSESDLRAWRPEKRRGGRKAATT